MAKQKFCKIYKNFNFFSILIFLKKLFFKNNIYFFSKKNLFLEFAGIARKVKVMVIIILSIFSMATIKTFLMEDNLQCMMEQSRAQASLYVRMIRKQRYVFHNWNKIKTEDGGSLEYHPVNEAFKWMIQMNSYRWRSNIIHERVWKGGYLQTKKNCKIVIEVAKIKTPRWTK